jgi:hypothetical protein
MTKLMSTTMTALLALAGASGALAQGTSGAPVVVQPGPAYSSEMTGVPALRQRQPRRGDLPEADRQPGGINYIDPADAELDRKIRSICRGC